MGLLGDVADYLKKKAVQLFSWWYGLEKIDGKDYIIVEKYLPLIHQNLENKKGEAIKNQLKQNLMNVFQVAVINDLAKLLQIITYNSDFFEKKLVKYNKSFEKEEANELFDLIKKFLIDAIINKLFKLDNNELEEKIAAELDKWEFNYSNKLVF